MTGVQTCALPICHGRRAVLLQLVAAGLAADGSGERGFLHTDPIGRVYLPLDGRRVDVLSKLGDKWTMLIMVTLKTNGTMRFCDIQKTIGDISQRMLTVTLRSLETDGLVIRKVYAEVPPRVEYSLTEMGHSLMPHIESLGGWALEHMADILERRGVQQEVD